jgi:putative ABC transport system permease protein
MIKNYITIAFRQLLKNRTFSFINIFGLTLGFLCFTLLALYVHDELSFDMFHRDVTRMYRVIQHEQQEDGTIRNVAPVANLIAQESTTQFSEVEETCRLTVFGRATLGNDPANRDYERIVTTDANFFTFFDYPLIEGNPEEVLKSPDAIVLSEKMAKKYFGNGPAVGQQIWSSINRDGQPVYFTVTGVMKDFPKNSHLSIDAIFSESTWPSIFRWYTNYINTDWTSNGYMTYFKTKDGADIKAIERKIGELVQAHYPKEREFKSSFTLQPFQDIHMYSEGIQGNDINTNGLKPFYLYMFGAVGFLLLLIACFNYMNLSTAAAFKRTREIGTRKSLGALRAQLIMQFTGEALVLSGIALILSFAFLQLVLPSVNSFTNKNMNLIQLELPMLLGIIVVMLSIGLLSALYPAWIISRIAPSEAMKKEIRLANRSLPIRKVLIVAQFTVSIIMTASTIIIYNQLQYLRSKELGVTIDDLVVVDINSRILRRDFEAIKSEFNTLTEVSSVCVTSRVPGEWKNYPVASVKAPGNLAPMDMIFVGADKDFLQTYNIKLQDGRNFSAAVADSSKIILSNLAVQQLGLTDPIGAIIEIPKARFGGQIDEFPQPFRAEVIGVIDNFHFESLRSEMMPLVMGFWNNPIQSIDYYTLKVSTNYMSETISRLKAINTKFDPENPLEYTFLSNRFEEFYQADAKRGQIFLTFSGIIILIACMGLFALVSYSVESRTKEIGVRKVLGASVGSIVNLVSREFLWLVGIACIIAIPAAFFFMQAWLKDFAYRISMGVGSFILAGLLATGIAFLTVSLRTLKAATENPVKSLRSE